ncbi:MAG: N-acetylmuramoyl-L-alanine amidase [Deltaproteobacteria bacterium]|nr:N-acetylmuramoyl-L-alanine amidase [Deltaproteobacteria bacterium]
MRAHLVTLTTFLLIAACDKGPSTSSSPVSDAAADATPTPPKPRAALTLEIKRKPHAFEAHGTVPDGVMPPSIRGRLDAFDAKSFEFTALTGATDPDRDAFAALLDASMLLDTGTIEVTAKGLRITGKARTHAGLAALQRLAGLAAKILEIDPTLELGLDAARLDPDEGFLLFADGTPADLPLRPIAGGDALHPDDVGRVPVGVYNFDETPGLRVAIAPGRTTYLRKGVTTGILIGGKRYPLDADVKLVVPGDPGALDFVAKSTGPDGMPLHGPRYLTPGQKLEPGKVLEHTNAIHQAILHFNTADDSAKSFADQVKNSLSVHFMIDWDGTIYQGLDVADCAYHAGEANNQGIGIDLNNLAPLLHMKPKAPHFPKKHSRLAEMQSPEYARPTQSGEINGVKVTTLGYTAAQYRALGSLLRTLTTVFPTLAIGAPRDAKGQVPNRTLDDPAKHDGVLAHYHWEVDRWDPGPAFDWDRLGLNDSPQPAAAPK